MESLIDTKMKSIEPVISTIFDELLKVFAEIFADEPGWKDNKRFIYSPWDIFERITQACVNNTSIEDACDTYEGCSADVVFRRINSLDFSQTVEKLNQALHFIFSKFGIHGNQPLNLQIDINDQEYYGSSKCELSTKSKAKNGTNKFNRFVTASLQIGKRSIPIYIRPMLKDDSFSPYDIITELFETLEPNFLIDRVFADGYFSASDVIDYLQTKGLEYIFNMKEYSGVKEMIKSYKEMFLSSHPLEVRQNLKDNEFYAWLKQSNLIYSDFMFSYNSAPDVQFKVILKAILYKNRKANGEEEWKVVFYSYCTNIIASLQYTTSLYAKRWGIETGYRVIDRFKGFTTTQQIIPRILLYGIGMLLVCLWLLLNSLLNHQNWLNILITGILLIVPIRKSHQLITTGKKFLRLIRKHWIEKEVFF